MTAAAIQRPMGWSALVSMAWACQSRGERDQRGGVVRGCISLVPSSVRSAVTRGEPGIRGFMAGSGVGLGRLRARVWCCFCWLSVVCMGRCAPARLIPLNGLVAPGTGTNPTLQGGTSAVQGSMLPVCGCLCCGRTAQADWQGLTRVRWGVRPGPGTLAESQTCWFRRGQRVCGAVLWRGYGTAPLTWGGATLGSSRMSGGRGYGRQTSFFCPGA